MVERSFVLLKPDCIERRLVGSCISYLEHPSLRITDIFKVLSVTKPKVCGHYQHLESHIVEEIWQYFRNGTLIGIEIEGDDAIFRVRQIVGITNPSMAQKGTIRGDFGKDSFDLAKTRPVGQRALRNLIHASDSVENAIREYNIWCGD